MEKTMTAQQITRRLDRSIGIDFYRQKGLMERRAVMTDFFRGHESSHQWWGHRVGWKSYHDQWLSEGFAEFSGLFYVQYRENMKESLT